MNTKLAVYLVALAATTSFAADPFTDAAQSAYAPYRVALFMTNSQSQPNSQQAIKDAQQAWASVMAKFAAHAPAPYDRDPSFPGVLTDVNQVYAKAADEINRNALAEAHETLEKVRDLLAELRARNNVVVYSDLMNAYHTSLENILGTGEKTLAQVDGTKLLLLNTGVMEYQADRLLNEASTAQLGNDEFLLLIKSVRQSVADLRTALLASDIEKSKEALKKLKPAYSKFFLKFG